MFVVLDGLTVLGQTLCEMRRSREVEIEADRDPAMRPVRSEVIAFVSDRSEDI